MNRDERIETIRRMRAGNMSMEAIGAQFKISKQAVSAILLRADRRAMDQGLSEGGPGISSEDLQAARTLAIQYDRSIILLDEVHADLKQSKPNKETAQIIIKIISEVRLLSEARARHLKILSSVEAMALFQKNLTKILREVCDEKTVTEIGKRLREARA